eukprot:scaffold383392_cov34-Prasinocladus_malaysianus.AAC.1
MIGFRLSGMANMALRGLSKVAGASARGARRGAATLPLAPRLQHSVLATKGGVFKQEPSFNLRCFAASASESDLLEVFKEEIRHEKEEYEPPE